MSGYAIGEMLGILDNPSLFVRRLAVLDKITDIEQYKKMLIELSKMTTFTYCSEEQPTITMHLEPSNIIIKTYANAIIYYIPNKFVFSGINEEYNFELSIQDTNFEATTTEHFVRRCLDYIEIINKNPQFMDWYLKQARPEVALQQCQCQVDAEKAQVLIEHAGKARALKEKWNSDIDFGFLNDTFVRTLKTKEYKILTKSTFDLLKKVNSELSLFFLTGESLYIENNEWDPKWVFYVKNKKGEWCRSNKSNMAFKRLKVVQNLKSR